MNASTAHLLLVALVVMALLTIASTVETHSNNPATGCRFDEVLTAEGVCR